MRHFLSTATASVGFVLRKVRGTTGACALIATGSAGGGTIRRPTLTQTVGVFGSMLLIPMLVMALVALALSEPVTAYALATPAAAAATTEKKPANIRKMEADLKALAKELEQGQTEMAAGPITPERGEELEGKAKEMEDLQDHIDRYNRIAGVARKAKEATTVTLPHEGDGARKSLRTTAGHLFVASEEFRSYRAQGKQGWSAKVDIRSRPGRFVRLHGEEAQKFEAKAFDPATLSDLGANAIIEQDRDRELIRFEEPEILTIRDVLNSAPTTSDSIRFVRHTATERAAESQNPRRGGLKPYLRVDFDPQTVSVETIAVLSKVTEQDVDDAPRLVSYINGEMALDIRVEEERQLLWGLGEDGELDGLFTQGIPEFNRAGVNDTLIDVIRKMRTNVRKRRVQPSFVTIDPLDWEQIELEKGSDDRYVWGLITDLRGPRIWSLRVVESDGMTHPTTGERRVLLGDGVRGATVYDRHDVRLAIGYVDDDFARNLRTLRGEERLALAVKRPFAFEYAVTGQAES